MQDEFVPPERIGFVGLGNMGAPMARHLAVAGYRVVAADSSAAALDRFCGTAPCERAASLAQLGRSCRLVITMLPDGRAVREVLLGGEGVAAHLAAGSVVMDMTSAEPVATRGLGRTLAQSSISLVDAPVSGGVKRAVEGTLAIMAGGEPATIARCKPVLDKLGQVFVTGASGSGHAMKALNNYLSAIALAATGEAMLAGEKFGIEPARMLEILNHSTGRNTATDQKYPAYILTGRFDSGFALGLMAKDLRIALGLAEAVGTPAAILGQCSDLWNRAERLLGAGADNTEIVRYLGRSQGSTVDD
ncbi:MAG TPA: NAD(P)-dependent oxidoreductase [Steroidobacteraceae bacterium]|nr:NAD(P)-dependent oxidoreductase [Steroidobacteraceae bacterium]